MPNLTSLISGQTTDCEVIISNTANYSGNASAFQINLAADNCSQQLYANCNYMALALHHNSQTKNIKKHVYKFIP